MRGGRHERQTARFTLPLPALAARELAVRGREAAEELVSSVMLRVENEAPGALMALIADAEQRTLPQLGAAIDRALSAAARKGKGKGGGGGRGRGKGKGGPSGLRWYTRTGRGGNQQG